MELNIELITKIIIPIIGAILTYIIVPFVKKVVIPWFKAKTESANMDNIYSLVKWAVRAAEQELKKVDPTGIRRKEYVLDYLNKKNIKISMEDLNNMIESAVIELDIAKGKFNNQEARE